VLLPVVLDEMEDKKEDGTKDARVCTPTLVLSGLLVLQSGSLLLFYLFWLGIKQRVSSMLGKCSTTFIYPYPRDFSFQ
jgi:hypothetical protein